MARLDPLSREEMGEFEHLFVEAERRGRSVPNFVRTMARRPEIVRAHQALRKAVMGPGTVGEDFKVLLALMSSFTAGCGYCSAHTANFSVEHNVPAEKAGALFEFETSAMFSEAERAALTVARHASQVPNAVSDAEFAALRHHYTDEQVVEILGVVGLYGYFNRINDTLATELEAAPICSAERLLGPRGWQAGKHGPGGD